MTELKNRTALVTGGSSGIGLAAAQALAASGATVFITGRRGQELDKAMELIGGPVHAFQGDVSNLDDLDRLFAFIKEKAGRLDVVFANAGIAEFSPLGSVTETHYDRHFDINVKGLFFTVQKALPFVADGGSIILTSSIAGEKGIPDFSVYSATKAAIRSFARSWTSELRDRKIRVNAISPGPIETPIFREAGFTQEQMEATKQHFSSLVPLGRYGQPDEVAQAVLFLASDLSSFITGIELPVDGGLAQV